MATQPAMFPEIEGPDFIRSDEVAAVGGKVLDLHGGIGGVARLHPIAEAVGEGELAILWLLNTKPFNPDTEDDQQPEIAGKCVKAPGLWRDITGFHFAIWARKYFWDQFDEAGRRALILHELLHIEVERDKNGQAKLSTRKHDVEDFVDVARQYGPAALAGDGARYVRAAAAFAGEPEPIGVPRAVIEAVADLARGATSDGIDSITVTAGGESVTLDAAASARIDATLGITPAARKNKALADATAHRLGRSKAQAAARPSPELTADDRVGRLRCNGSNHVPGHTPDSPKRDPNTDPDDPQPF